MKCIIDRVGVHARERQPRFFFNGLNLTVVENDLAVLKVKNPETLQCEERKIWPACLPEKVTVLTMNERLGKINPRVKAILGNQKL